MVKVLDSKNQVQGVVGVFLGCDPEFFFVRKGGEVIGSEKVLKTPVASGAAKFVMDGVQVELNPCPHSCREGLGGEISLAFRALKLHLEKAGDIEASFTTVVEVDKKELDTLSDRAKVFGCAPSLNAYGRAPSVTLDAEKYRKRSAGGHIHLGISTAAYPWMKGTLPRLVPLLDIFLGNTCVLLDRDPEAIERRRVYGRAGEHRLPAHGLEYRTLSNFWLRSYQLTSFVMGVARQTTNIFAHGLYYTQPNVPVYDATTKAWSPEEEILSLVDLRKVEEAINTNNLPLAQENWEVVKKFLAAHAHNFSYGLMPSCFKNFDRFAARVQAEGLERVFPENPIDHWATLNNTGQARGWERFIAAQ